jgi:chromosome segregation ATPase
LRQRTSRLTESINRTEDDIRDKEHKIRNLQNEGQLLKQRLDYYEKDKGMKEKELELKKSSVNSEILRLTNQFERDKKEILELDFERQQKTKELEQARAFVKDQVSHLGSYLLNVKKDKVEKIGIEGERVVSVKDNIIKYLNNKVHSKKLN